MKNLGFLIPFSDLIPGARVRPTISALAPADVVAPPAPAPVLTCLS
jgi:hypothetical protein